MQGDDRDETGRRGSADMMEGALAVAFGRDGDSPGGGVVEALSRAGVPPSRVLLREAPEEAPAPVVTLHGSSGRTDRGRALPGRSARSRAAAWASCSRGATRTSAATWR